MPKGQRKDYTKEFKLAAVFMMKSGKFKPKDIFQMLGGIDRQTVYRWVKQYDEFGEAAFPGNAPTKGSELARLKRERDDLKMENEILKKATAYFAKENVKK